MIKNYLLIALRTLRRNPGFTILNISGLAIGIACTLLLSLYIKQELSYDQFHEDADRIYRVHTAGPEDSSPAIVAPLLKSSFAEVEATARMYDIGQFQSPVIRFGDRQFYESGFFYADSTIFDVLSFSFVEGNAIDALQRPNTIVITEEIAQKYFGNRSPMGELLEIGGSKRTFEVTGVIDNVPAESHVQFDFLASFTSSRWSRDEGWYPANFYTYVKLSEGADAGAVSRKIDGLVAEAKAQELVQGEYALSLMPLLSIRTEFEGRSNTILLLSTIAFLVLLVACVNYVNLSTARGAQRAKEVGVRKVSGAQRMQLAGQFMGESILVTMMSLTLAVCIAVISLPVFNAISGLELTPDILASPGFILFIVCLGLVVSTIGGAYPAFLLSSFQPIQILRKVSKTNTGKSRLRRSLVTFQFAVSVVLLICTAVVFKQLDFMQTKDLGFDKEQVLVIPIGLGNEIQDEYRAFREALLQESGVVDVASINHIPGYQEGGYGFWAQGVFEDDQRIPEIGGVPSDEHVMDALGLQLIAGGDFLGSHPDSIETGRYQYILNESAIRQAGWAPDEAVGKRIALSSNRQGYVVGVIADYHFLSLHQDITPLAYFYEPWGSNQMIVRLAQGPLTSSIQQVQSVWSQWFPDRPFDYTFLDEELSALYRSEAQASQLFLFAAILAVIIACLGLFGLAAFMAAQRTREVGIRKVLGASVSQVISLLTREFSILVVIGFVVATPIAFMISRQWLQSFAYQISMPWLLYVGAGLLVLCIAWLTVSFQAFRAARTNPVEALRYE